MNGYLLVTSELSDRPEANRALARSVMAGFQVLWHPELLVKAYQLPALRSVDDALMGESFVVCPRGIWDTFTAPQRLDWSDRSPATHVIDLAAVDRQGLVDLSNRLGLTETGITTDFHAFGFAYLSLQVVLRGMGQATPFDEDSLFQEIQRAALANQAGELDEARECLKSAFESLLSARQMVYPATISIVDIALLGEDAQVQQLESRPTHLPINVMLAGKTLDALAAAKPEVIEILKDRLLASQIELLCGNYSDRSFASLPFESRCFELTSCMGVIRQHLGDVAWQFGSRVNSLSPTLPLLLTKFSLRYALHTCFDGGKHPHFRDPNIQWSCPDGSSIESLARTAMDASDDSNVIAVSESLARTIMSDRSATLVFAHWFSRPSAWHSWMLKVHEYVTLFGQFVTFGDYFLNASMADSATVTYASEYNSRSLQRSMQTRTTNPISNSIRQFERRGSWESFATLASISNMLSPVAVNDVDIPEEQMESDSPGVSALLQEKLSAKARELSDVVLRGATGRRGYLAFNPTAATRRAGLIVEDAIATSVVGGPIRQVQPTKSGTAVVVDIPGFGFAWIPAGNDQDRDEAESAANTALRTQSLAPAIANGKRLRNEFVELEIDSSTGGIRGLWTLPGGYSRLAQRLVLGQAGDARCDGHEITASGPAFSEIITIGRLVKSEQTFASFSQRVRVWAGTPIIELAISIEPASDAPTFAAQEYIACRWAWPDEKSTMMTSDGYWLLANGGEEIETTSLIEIRERNIVTQILTDGLVEHRRDSARMTDTILQIAGETATEFQMRIGLDLRHPMVAVQHAFRPPVVSAVEHGPPRVGRSSWFVNLTPANVICAQLRPVSLDEGCGIQMHLVETAGVSSKTKIRFAKTPSEARLVTGGGDLVYNLSIEDDAVTLDLSSSEYVIIEVLFP